MNFKKYEIKLAQKGDEKDIIALVHYVVKASLSSVYTPSVIDWFYDYHSIDHLSEEIDNSAYIFVVYFGHEIIGTVTYYNHELKRLFIRPDYQKSGIGKRLIEKVEELAKEIGSTHIMLYANPAAWKYYAAKGYEPINFAAEEINPGDYLTFCTMVKELIPRSWEIFKANINEAGEILKGQKKAFEAVARAHSHMDMPPMSETANDVSEAMKRCSVYVAKGGSKIIGSVRGEEKDGACYISRLWVLPEYQGKGLGHALMHAAEEEFARLPKYELFTGSKSKKTIEFYRERCYCETKRIPCKDYELIYMEKKNVKNMIG